MGLNLQIAEVKVIEIYKLFLSRNFIYVLNYWQID